MYEVWNGVLNLNFQSQMKPQYQIFMLQIPFRREPHKGPPRNYGYYENLIPLNVEVILSLDHGYQY